MKEKMDMPMAEPEMNDGMLNDDLGTLHKAHKIKKDKKKMKALHKHAKEQMSAIGKEEAMDSAPDDESKEVSSIADIRKKAYSKK